VNPETVRWVIENRNRYTPEALRAKLLESRHRPADIDLLLRTEDLSPLLIGAEKVERAKGRASRIVIVAFVVAFLGLAALTVVSFQNVAALGLAFLAASMVAGVLLSVAVARGVAGRQGLQDSPVNLVAVLFIPAAILLGISGTCLAAVVPGLQ
jgi:hypothetical protein